MAPLEVILSISSAHPETGQAAGAQTLLTSCWTLQYRSYLAFRATPTLLGRMRLFTPSQMSRQGTGLQCQQCAHCPCPFAYAPT